MDKADKIFYALAITGLILCTINLIIVISNTKNHGKKQEIQSTVQCIQRR